MMRLMASCGLALVFSLIAEVSSLAQPPAPVKLREPDVVILDEPSSKLDPATERLVRRAFARLLEGRTGIIVAHRLSTFALADDILVLEDGAVREHGPRLALAADPDSRYAAMLRLAAGEVLA